MIKKLILATALVAAAAASNPTPAPAIEFICSCDLCRARPNVGCWIVGQPPPFNRTSCSNYLATRC